MTIEKMHRDFEVRIRTLNAIKMFTSSEIDVYLNKAQRSLFEELVPLYDDDDRIKRILFPLLRTKVYTSLIKATNGKTIGSVYVELPSDFKIVKGERAVIFLVDGSSTSVRVKSVSQDYFNLNINNPFKKPYVDLVWRMDYPNEESSNKRHELIPGVGNTISEYALRYIKDIDDVNIFEGIGSEMHSMVHDDLVERAAILAMQGLVDNEQETQ